MDPRLTARQLMWTATRGYRVIFIVGFLLGIVVGWAFSGIVGTFLRFGVVALLLIPLAVALYFRWRIRRAPEPADMDEGPTTASWSSGGGLPPSSSIDDLLRQMQAQQDRIDELDGDVIDIESTSSRGRRS